MIIAKSQNLILHDIILQYFNFYTAEDWKLRMLQVIGGKGKQTADIHYCSNPMTFCYHIACLKLKWLKVGLIASMYSILNPSLLFLLKEDQLGFKHCMVYLFQLNEGPFGAGTFPIKRLLYSDLNLNLSIIQILSNACFKNFYIDDFKNCPLWNSQNWLFQRQTTAICLQNKLPFETYMKS